MNGEDFALVCDACACVTIFQDDASYPKRCARCNHVLRASAIDALRRRAARLAFPALGAGLDLEPPCL